MDIEVSGELSGIFEVLRQMSMFETKIAELYSTCASTWKEDCQFWLHIWRDELSHALYINNITEIIAKNLNYSRKDSLSMSLRRSHEYV